MTLLLASLLLACSPRPHPLSPAVAVAAQVARIKKCCQIMGRQEGTLTAAQILYPIMQCTDIFFLRADICQLGVDQRKVRTPRRACLRKRARARVVHPSVRACAWRAWRMACMPRSSVVP